MSLESFFCYYQKYSYIVSAHLDTWWDHQREKKGCNICEIYNNKIDIKKKFEYVDPWAAFEIT